MKRDYITGDFDSDFMKTVKLLKDKNIKQESREEIAIDFCSVYQYFDSLKFDKYLY